MGSFPAVRRRSFGRDVPAWSDGAVRSIKPLADGTRGRLFVRPASVDAAAKLLEEQVIDTSPGKVVVNRSMSLDGFIAGPGHAMDWGGDRPLADFVAPDDVREIASATGAMLIGRRTYEVGRRMQAEEPSSGDYPFSGSFFVLTHRPPDPPDPEVTFLSGDIGEAVATALDAAGGKNLEILGADVAGQCLQRGLVDEILVYVMPVLLGDGIRFSPPDLPRIDLELVDSRRSRDAAILRFHVRP
jgi:dihydrofolate reductase